MSQYNIRNGSKHFLSTFFAILTVILFILPTNAHAEGFYIGAGAGFSSLSALDPSNVDDGSFISRHADDSDTGVKIFLGYEVNQNFAVEFSYVDLGEFKINGISDGTSIFWVAGPTTTTIEVDGFAFAVVGKAPMGESLSVFTKLGLFIWDEEVTFTGSCCTASASDDGTGAIVGFGSQYDFSDRMGVRAEMELYPDIGNYGDGKIISLSLVIKL